MFSFGFAQTSTLILVSSLHLSTAFMGCCDDPPDPPQPPTPQPVTNTTITIDIPDIVESLKPGDKVRIVAHTSSITAESNLDITGLETIVRKEYNEGYYYFFIEKLKALLKLLFAPGLNLLSGVEEAGSGLDAPGGPAGSSVTALSGRAHIKPKPLSMFRHWNSAPITTKTLSPLVISAIENDPYQTPIRFSVSLPFDTTQEFLDSGVQGFWVDALDARGNSVMPPGATLVNTSTSEWPITSRIIWDPAQPEVTVLSFDLVNSDGSMVTPTQLSCDVRPVTFTFGMSTSDIKASWDFAWAAGLWRTEVDEQGTHHGDGGMWLGWHFTSYDGKPPILDVPRILEVTDLSGNPVTSVDRGDVITVTVQNGLPVSEVEISLGGYVVHDILASGPGANPGETYYVFQVPLASHLGSWALFFRQNGATHLSNPSMIGLIAPGYDYTNLIIN